MSGQTCYGFNQQTIFEKRGTMKKSTHSRREALKRIGLFGVAVAPGMKGQTA